MSQYHANPPGDVAIDIPLATVQSSRGAGVRKVTTNVSSSSHGTEKELLAPTDAEMMQTKSKHFHRAAGRRKKLENQAKEDVNSQDGTLTAMGRLYDKIYNFSVITRYLLYVVPVAFLIAIPIVIGATVAPNARVGGTRMTYFCVWLEIVWCSIWISKVVVRCLPYLFQFVIGVISSGTRKYALILAALEIPLSLVLWAVTSLATFRPLMTLTPGRIGDSIYWIQVIEKILFACLFSLLLLLVEKVLIQLISITYHRRQFHGKIKESKRNIYLLTLLYEASQAMFPHYCPEFAEEDFVIGDTLGLNALATPHHNRSGSGTPMRILQNVQRVGDQVANIFGNMASEITGKQIFNQTTAHSIVIQALEKRRSSEALARRIWLSFVLEGKDALHIADVIEVFGSDKEEEAREVFACLDMDGNGDVSLEEMILRVSELGRERAALANSMRDVDEAITVLDTLLMTVVFIGAVFIFVAWLNTNFTTTLATAGTALLSLSFVFSVTAQELLGSCIFLFVKHPFDVGDRCDVSNEQLVVEKISLLYTIFKRVKDNKRTQVPNIVLNSLWIDNVSRSQAMKEQISLFVSFDTTFDDIELLRKQMQDFVGAKDNARDFQPEVEIEVLSMAEMNKLELKIEIRHKSNWAIETIRAARRSKFMCALVLAMKKVPIHAPGGGNPAAGDKANPNYSVAITDAEAKANKDKFDKDKDAKRLLPLNSNDAKSSSVDLFAGSSVEEKERAQAQALNQRHVVVDPSEVGMDEVTSAVSARQRSNDLEEVKNIMRRESTRGKRKPGLQPVTSPTAEAYSGYGATNASIPSSDQQTGHFGDNRYGAPGQAGRPAVRVSSPTSSSATDVPPIHTQSQGRFRSESIPETPTIYEGVPVVPGNAFSQVRQTSTQGESYANRRPVPGMSEMKDHLQQPQQGGQR